MCITHSNSSSTQGSSNPDLTHYPTYYPQEEPWKAPVTSQLKLSREKKYSNRHASITLLASIPVTWFKHTDAALPLCGTAWMLSPKALEVLIVQILLISKGTFTSIRVLKLTLQPLICRYMSWHIQRWRWITTSPLFSLFPPSMCWWVASRI